MTYSLSIPTVAPRAPHCEYLIARLVETGAFSHPLVKGVHITRDLPPNLNAHHAMRAAARDDADWVLHLEDDIDIIDDFLGSVDRWLTDFAEPRVLFYPLGCAVRRAMRESRAAGARAWPFPLKEFFGATAVAIRTDDVRRFCDSYGADWMMRWNGLDVNLRRWHERAEPRQSFVLTPVPPFIDHMGAVSTQSTDPSHFTGRYPAYEGRHIAYP
jgi:hypothetical protein